MEILTFSIHPHCNEEWKTHLNWDWPLALLRAGLRKSVVAGRASTRLGREEGPLSALSALQQKVTSSKVLPDAHLRGKKKQFSDNPKKYDLHWAVMRIKTSLEQRDALTPL